MKVFLGTLRVQFRQPRRKNFDAEPKNFRSKSEQAFFVNDKLCFIKILPCTRGRLF